jgi:hypothetical protein
MTADERDELERLRADVDRLLRYAVYSTGGRMLIGPLAPGEARRGERILATEFQAQLTAKREAETFEGTAA